MSFIQFSKKKFKKRKKIIYKVGFFVFVFAAILIVISTLFGKKISENSPFTARITKSLGQDFESSILFNNSHGFNVFYNTTIDALESAKKTIQIAIYSIRDERIINILKEKKEQGLNIEIVVPMSKGSQHKKAFADTGLAIIEVGSLSDEENINELMHHKFVLVDADNENKQLIFGSSNLTYLQQKYDPSFLIKTKDENLINIFKHEFNLLKNHKYGLKKLSTGKFKPFAFDGEYRNGFVQIWFGPGYMKNSVKSKIIEYIHNAESSIDIVGWRINDIDIYKALVKKSTEGILVSVILDDYYMWDKLSIAQKVKETDNINIFSDSYMHILLDNKRDMLDDDLDKNFNSFLHHHSLVIDDSLLVAGTNNWGRGGFHYNDESIIITDIEGLVQGYVDQFDYLYRKLHGDELHFKIDFKNVLHIENLINDFSKIVFYREKEDQNWLGYICFEMTYSDYRDGISVPKECITDKTRIFMIDEYENLISSNYLK